MRPISMLRAGIAVLALSFVGLTTACASGPASNDQQAVPSSESEPGTSPESDDQTAAESAGGDGDYAFGADRKQMAEAIETAFKSQKGKAIWEGDTFVLSVDGDAASTMAGFSECMVLDQLLNEGDVTVIRFPNGEVKCEEALADL